MLNMEKSRILMIDDSTESGLIWLVKYKIFIFSNFKLVI